ncbi:MAG: ATP-binding cassette domain-containing protein [Lachnospiraceae bacterium]|nr:ATP-binding cassette domain-containing protein [Lachnospiraceae bacterium]
MSEIICQTTELCKKYKNFHVLQNIDLSINRGEIYGLVGENGAGKSTLIRILTGLAFQSSGMVTLFGKTGNLRYERAKIGCTVEMPALYKDMTAKQNLEIQRVQRGIPDKKCISKTLELTGLDNTKKKKVNDFSLGMKQRLALAVALLGEPEFLILDEPVNGLDPTGIIELRELLKRLSKENHVTVLISSHILSELNQLATCYGFLHNGKLLKQITAMELSQECKRHVKLKTDNTEQTVIVLEEQLKIKNFSIQPDNFIRVYEKLDETHTISKTLSSNGIVVEEISVQGEELETYFENLIGGGKYV